MKKIALTMMTIAMLGTISMSAFADQRAENQTAGGTKKSITIIQKLTIGYNGKPHAIAGTYTAGNEAVDLITCNVEETVSGNSRYDEQRDYHKVTTPDSYAVYADKANVYEFKSQHKVLSTKYGNWSRLNDPLVERKGMK